jgi:hypothetical protein
MLSEQKATKATKGFRFIAASLRLLRSLLRLTVEGGGGDCVLTEGVTGSGKLLWTSHFAPLKLAAMKSEWSQYRWVARM